MKKIFITVLILSFTPFISATATAWCVGNTSKTVNESYFCCSDVVTACWGKNSFTGEKKVCKDVGEGMVCSTY